MFKALVACEESQAITIELRKLGVEAYSCDLKQCSGGHPEWHIQGDMFEAIAKGNYTLLIAHPPCTYLAVTGNKWELDQPPRESGALVGEERRKAKQEAAEFFMQIAKCDIEYICIENPVGYMSSYWRKPDQIIQPMSYGHKEAKKTCLWLKNLPLLQSTTKRVKPEYTTFKSGKRMATWYVEARRNNDNAISSELRSKSFEGISKAIAEQYTRFIISNYKTKLF
jgi:hypothetical protein